MTSKVQIANVALTLLGANTISSFTETSTEATLVNVHYDQARKEILRAHPWNFAIKRQELAQGVTTPLFNYTYTFSLPTDLILLREVYLDEDYKVEGRYILTNSDSCKIKYVYNNEDPNSYDATFIDLLSYSLAQRLCYALTKSATKEAEMYGIFKEKLQKARFEDSSEDIEDSFGFESDLIRARY